MQVVLRMPKGKFWVLVDEELSGWISEKGGSRQRLNRKKESTNGEREQKINVLRSIILSIACLCSYVASQPILPVTGVNSVVQECCLLM